MTALSGAHRRHLATLRQLPASIDREGLRIGAQYVMFFAEADLMRHHARHLVEGRDQPDVLEVGLGLGVFAEQMARLGVGSYTAVEPHPGVAQLAEHRLWMAFRDQVTVLTQPWQLVTLPTKAFDAIMYDTWPPDGYADSDFADFVAQVAVPCLRPGGRFSFFHSGSTLPATRIAVLNKHFPQWLAHPFALTEADTPQHWTKPSRDFLIPIATKGDTRR